MSRIRIGIATAATPDVRAPSAASVRTPVKRVWALAISLALAVALCAVAQGAQTPLRLDVRVESLAASADPVLHDSPDAVFTRLQGLALDASGRPHVLASRSKDRFGAGAHEMIVVRTAEGGATATIPLQTVDGLPEFIAFAMTDGGDYALATGARGVARLDLYSAQGQSKGKLAAELREEVPVALFSVPDGWLLVTNGALHAIGLDGQITRSQRAAPGRLIAAAARLPGECGWVILLVDEALRFRELERRCGAEREFSVQASVAVPADLAGRPRATLAIAGSSAVAFPAAAAGRADAWALVSCELANGGRCRSKRLAAVPQSLALLTSGLQLSADGQALITVSASQNGDRLRVSSVSGRGHKGHPQRVLTLPASSGGGSPVAERLIVLPAPGGFWLAVGYWTLDADWSAGRTPTQLQTVVGAARIEGRGVAPP